MFVYHAVNLSKYPVKYRANETTSNNTITTLNINHAVEDGVSCVSEVPEIEPDTESEAAGVSAFGFDEKELETEAMTVRNTAETKRRLSW